MGLHVGSQRVENCDRKTVENFESSVWGIAKDLERIPPNIPSKKKKEQNKTKKEREREREKERERERERNREGKGGGKKLIYYYLL